MSAIDRLLVLTKSPLFVTQWGTVPWKIYKHIFYICIYGICIYSTDIHLNMRTACERNLEANTCEQTTDIKWQAALTLHNTSHTELHTRPSAQLNVHVQLIYCHNHTRQTDCHQRNYGQTVSCFGKKRKWINKLLLVIFLTIVCRS